MKGDISISNLKVSDDKKSISWDFNGNTVSVDVEKTQQALVDERKNQVLAIVGKDETSSLLFVFQGNGKISQQFNCTQDFYFSYLTQHPEYGLCSVCSTDRPIDDWYDWYFSIDFRRGVIIRQGPSY